MSHTTPLPPKSKHLRMTEPSDWIVRFQPLIPTQGQVLDLAAGGGRHTRFLLNAGHRVTALDRTVEPLQEFAAHDACTVIEADLEDGSPWPFTPQTFDAVLVVNYLHRTLFPTLFDSLKPGGVFLYETFARGNEIYNRPRNPDHLLRSGELLTFCADNLQVVAYEHGVIQGDECPGVKQRICAVKDLSLSARDDGEPSPHAVWPLTTD